MTPEEKENILRAQGRKCVEEISGSNEEKEGAIQ